MAVSSWATSVLYLVLLPGGGASAGEEFVAELLVTPPALPSAGPGVAPLKIVNPDGQCAEL